MRRGEQVAGLVGGAGRGAGSLEDLGPRREGWRLRSVPAGGDTPHQQASLVGHPLDGRSQEGVEGHAPDLAQLAIHRAHPQAQVVGVLHLQGEALAVHGPRHAEELGAVGEGEGHLGAVLHPEQAGGDGAPVAVEPVDHRIDPHARQLVHRPRQLGQVRVRDRVGQEQVAAPGCGPHPGEAGRVEDVEDLLGRLLPPPRRGGQAGEQGEQERERRGGAPPAGRSASALHPAMQVIHDPSSRRELTKLRGLAERSRDALARRACGVEP